MGNIRFSFIYIRLYSQRRVTRTRGDGKKIKVTMKILIQAKIWLEKPYHMHMDGLLSWASALSLDLWNGNPGKSVNWICLRYGTWSLSHIHLDQVFFNKTMEVPLVERQNWVKVHSHRHGIMTNEYQWSSERIAQYTAPEV